jgi:hypothetical protein
MKRFAAHSLSLQLPLVAAVAALIVGLCLLWLAATASSHLQAQQEQRYGDALARQLAASLREPLQSGDLLAARATLQRFLDSSLADSILISDVEGAPIGSAGASLGPGARPYRAPITIGGDVAGEVRLAVEGSAGRESRWRFIFSLLALTAALSLLVFLATRFLARGIARRLAGLAARLAVATGADAQREEERGGMEDNELLLLENTVAAMPLEMLHGHAPVPRAASDFQDTVILFVHLASLVRYVDTLSESNLHRYTRRLQQLVQAAAHCYRGELTVARPFGLLLTFAPQPNTGGEAFRAASCALLLRRVAEGLQQSTKLSIDLSMALGHCEESRDRVDDIYPALHLQGAIDELHGACLHEEAATILVDDRVSGDGELTAIARYEQAAPGTEDRFRRLLGLGEEQEALIGHQADLIVGRIAPNRDGPAARSSG